MSVANTLQRSLFWGKVTLVIKLEQKNLTGFVLLIPKSGMQIFHVNISQFLESLTDNKRSTTFI